MGKYLDSSGVTYLWGKIKGLFTDNSLNTEKKNYTEAINEINTKVNNLTGAFVWKGKFDTLPAVTNYSAGDVVGVANKEYVLTVTGSTKTWVEFGDEANHITRDYAESTYFKNVDATYKVDTFTLTQILQEVDLSSSDKAVRKAALDAFKANWLALGNASLEGARFIAQFASISDVADAAFYDVAKGILMAYENNQFIGLANVHAEAAAGGDYVHLIYIKLALDGTVSVEDVKTGDNARLTKVEDNINTLTSYTLPELYLKKEDASTTYATKSSITPILQEIDLTGTDADRKAKLDQFEADWKALTGSDSLDGARFVGRLPATSTGQNNVLLTYNWADGEYKGLCSDDSYVNSSVSVSTTNGSLTITPLFSHLEAVVLRISDGDSNADTVNAANKASIENYVANLQSLGVSIEGTPCHFILLKYKNGNYTNYTVNVGILRLTEKNSQYDFWIDGVKGGVDYETGKVTISSNLNTTLEAITIYTDNTEEHMQMNLDNIAAYEANLQALGVDTSYGFSFNGIANGYTMQFVNSRHNKPKQFFAIQRYNSDGYFTTIYSDGRYYEESFSVSYTLKSLNAKSLEAITIQSGDTDAIKLANKTAIEGYVNNLKALGVDTTKGYVIPICFLDTEFGYVMYHPNSAGAKYTGIVTGPGGASSNVAIENSWVAYITTHIQPVESSTLTTTSKQIVGAINEVNAAVKTKQDALVSGTNIKTVNGTSLLGSGDVEISADMPTILLDVSASDVKAAVDALNGKPFIGETVISSADTLGGIGQHYAVMMPTSGTYSYQGIDEQGITYQLTSGGVFSRTRGRMELPFIQIGGSNGSTAYQLSQKFFADKYVSTRAIDVAVEIIESNATYRGTASMRCTSFPAYRFDGIVLNENHEAYAFYATGGTSGITTGGYTLTKIGGSGDVTAAGNNTFTGNNKFTGDNTFGKCPSFDLGISIEGATSGESYFLQTNPYTGKLYFSNQEDLPIEVHGVDTPTTDTSVANKKYVDDQIASVSGSSGSDTTAVILDFTGNGSSYTVPDSDYAKLQAGDCLVYIKLYSGSDFIQLHRDNNDSYSGTTNIDYIGYSSANFEDPIRVTVKSTKVATYTSIAAYNDIKLNRVQRYNSNSAISLSTTSLSKLAFIGDNIITELPAYNSFVSWDMFVIGTVTLPTITDTYNFVGMEAPSDLKLTAGFYKVLHYNHPSVRDKIYTIYKLA